MNIGVIDRRSMRGIPPRRPTRKARSGLPSGHRTFLLPHSLGYLHRALKPDGWHVMVLPFMPGHYDEYLGPLGEKKANERFGQHDHVRWFGDKDVFKTLGMIFRLHTL